MIQRKNVLCGNQQPLPLEINVDTVYKRYNIRPYQNEEQQGYVYDEDELTLVEYFKQIIPENQNINEQTLAELSILFAQQQAQTDAAIGELSIMIGGLLSNV